MSSCGKGHRRDGEGRQQEQQLVQLQGVMASSDPQNQQGLDDALADDTDDIEQLLPVGPTASADVSRAGGENGRNGTGGGELDEGGGRFLSAEASMKHLMWLSSPDLVFDAALGLSRPALAALVVVHHPKRDPREFFPCSRSWPCCPPHALQGGRATGPSRKGSGAYGPGSGIRAAGRPSSPRAAQRPSSRGAQTEESPGHSGQSDAGKGELQSSAESCGSARDRQGGWGWGYGSWAAAFGVVHVSRRGWPWRRLIRTACFLWLPQPFACRQEAA